MRTSFLILFGVVCALVSAKSYSHDRSRLVDSDSGIFGPDYKKILSQMQGWRDSYPEITQLLDYGKSVQGRPLRMMIVGKPGWQLDAWFERPALIITGSTHGNEYLNIEDRLPAEILKLSATRSAVQEYIEAGGVYLFVPILNPDGYDNRARENANGVDLNRDWDVDVAQFKGFKQIETRALATKLGSLRETMGLQYRASVDYHCCVGAVLYPWSYTSNPLPGTDLQAHLSLAKLAKELLNIDYGTTGEILGYYPVGTTKDYYYSEYGTAAFTYEGRYGSENQYLGKHVEWWEKISDKINKHELRMTRLP
jgi:hypothetical protein